MLVIPPIMTTIAITTTIMMIVITQIDSMNFVLNDLCGTMKEDKRINIRGSIIDSMPCLSGTKFCRQV